MSGALRPGPIRSVLTLLACQLLVGLSLGIYYNYTYFGRGAAPLPQPVAAAGAFLYYLFVAGGDGPQIQAWLWMLCFTLAGWLWLGAVWLTATWFATQPRAVLRASLMGLAPLAAATPVMALCHAWSPAGPGWQQFIQACLYRQFGPVPHGLVPLFTALALAGLVAEVVVLARANGMRLRRCLAWVASSILLTTIAVALLTSPFLGRS